MSVGDESARKTVAMRLVVPGCVTLFLLVLGIRLAALHVRLGALTIEDDAYYYQLIARNILKSGLSSFDGTTLSNGYHPLWMIVLVVQYATLGSANVTTVLVELVLCCGGLWFFLQSLKARSGVLAVLFTLAFTVLAVPMVAKGMEVSLLIFCLGFFTWSAVEQLSGRDRRIMLTLGAILAVAARLDAAVFVLPVLLIAIGDWRRCIMPVVLIAAAGLVYAGFNQWVFGVPMPISGAVKSLGGVQVNRALINEAFGDFAGRGLIAALPGFLNSLYGRLIIFFIVPLVGLLVAPRGSKSFALTVGYVIGFVLFAAKLVFGSSWVLWPWYGFPAILGLVCATHQIDDALIRARVKTLVWPVRWTAAAMVVGFLANQSLIAFYRPLPQAFSTVSAGAMPTFKPIFQGARVAMGDRAGLFAALYDGPLEQLEGLVNDRAYFQALQSGADIKPMLCARGVKFVVAFQKDLGTYETVTVPAIRRQLSQFEGPTLTLARADQVAVYSDLARYDNSAVDEGDNYLYAWRLSGCTPTPANGTVRP